MGVSFAVEASENYECIHYLWEISKEVKNELAHSFRDRQFMQNTHDPQDNSRQILACMLTKQLNAKP